MNICGREEEKKLLNKLATSTESQFLAIYGRRRVGKTYLIENYFRNKGIYFQFTGIKKASMREHLAAFQRDISKQLTINKKIPSFKNWQDAFFYLEDILSTLDPTKKQILFFDELPWIANRKSGFLQSLEHFWNHTFSKNNNAILIVCGSAASWIIDKIIYNKGGLHNRLTAQIRLEPFSLKETKQYLNYRNIFLDNKQIVDLYMTTGGVAKYLNYIEPGYSAVQNIQNLFFHQKAPLLQEYDKLFSSLFINYEDHKKIVETLAQKRSGMSYSELLKKTKKSAGGYFTKTLTELKESGFIDFIPTFNKKKKDGKYYLTDEYSFFYLTWVKALSESNLQFLSKNFWFQEHGRAKHLAWSGFAFETLCRKNLKQIVKALKIEEITKQAIHWQDHDTQIDLIIDRRDNCMNLCEIKYYSQEINITSEYAKKIRQKREIFREKTKTKKTLFNTLISIYGAKKNEHLGSSFEQKIILNDFFL